MKTQSFAVIVGTRGFFNEALAAGVRERLLLKLKALGFGALILPLESTPTGAIESEDDALACAAYLRDHAREIDGIIVTLPNFGDEVAITCALLESRLDVPVLIQAEPDELGKIGLDERRDSFCGKISVCNNLRQAGIQYTLTSEHTTAVDGPGFEADLRRFAAVCRLVNGLRHARIGAIGARPAAFQTVRYSEKILQACGVTVVTADLSEIIAAAQKLDSRAGIVKTKLEEIQAYGQITPSATPTMLDRQARLSAALDEWLAAKNVQAAAMLCWQSIQENYGCAACLSMSMNTNAGRPIACEVDICGALSMLALQLAAETPPALVDWNNNYASEPNKCVAQHCSAYAKDFINASLEIGYPSVLGKSLGNEICFGAVNGKAAAGPFTYLRLSTDDLNGKVRGYAGNGHLTADPFPMAGGIGVCEIPDMQKLFRYICRQGFEHHAALVRSHVADVIEEAFMTYLGWEVYIHT
jgi:L-fucose isomerase-like protein